MKLITNIKNSFANLEKSLAKKKKAILTLAKYKTSKVNFYEYVLTPLAGHANQDDVLRVHGFGLSRIGGRNQLVKVTNVETGKSFTAKAVGAGKDYKLRSKKAVILNYNQRAYLGLDSNTKKAKIVVHSEKSEEQIRRDELRYVKYGLFLTALGLLVSNLA